MIDDSVAEVGVTADRALVAEALTAALTACGFTVVRVPWPETPDASDQRTSPPLPPADQTIMLCDLEPARIGPARRLVRTHPSRWLVLTDAPRGPFWGALLEVGVLAILPSTITLDHLIAVIADVAADRHLDVPDRDALVAEWRRARARHADAVARLSTMTASQLEILEMLGSGLSVPQVATARGVAPSTVRSQVRSVLRKLGVHSQVAAVAMLARARWRHPDSASLPADWD